MIADPDDGGMRPTRIDMVVVLPAPLWPSSARESGDGERYCNSDTGDLAFKHVQRQVFDSHFPVLHNGQKRVPSGRATNIELLAKMGYFNARRRSLCAVNKYLAGQ